MSSEKLSPRQQMIGMMYLVLTAMLALNVSSSVLDKYGVINASLERTFQKNIQYCESKLKQIQKAVDDSGRKEKDLEKVKIADESLNKTNEVCLALKQMKEEMVTLSGGYDKKNPQKPKDGKNDAIVARYMIKNDNANKLKDLVNNHLDYLSSLSETKFSHIALDANDDPFFCDDANQSGKPYAILNFADHVPLVAAMATISEYQTTLTDACSEIIDSLYNSVGADQLKFDTFRPLLSSISNTVVAGTNYKAEMYLAASSSAIVPKMFINGQGINVSKEGIGNISLTTPKDLKFDEDGIAIRNINATIKQFNPTTGESVNINKTFQYKIVRPVLDAQSVSVNSLYRNCGNEMVIKCAALGTNYNPVFKITGGVIIKTPNNKNKITIIPSTELKSKDDKVVVAVYSDSTFLGNLTYSVKGVPLPQISVLSNGKIVDERKGVNPDIIKTIGIKVTPDESFGNFLPNDAKYKVSKWTVSACKGSNALFSKNVEDINTLMLNGNEKMLLYQADRILIEVKNVVRINCKGEEEGVFAIGGQVTKNIPISANIF